MNFRISLVVLSQSPKVEIFAHCQKIESPRNPAIKAIQKVVRTPSSMSQELYTRLAKQTVVAALPGYGSENRFYVALTKKGDVYEAVLYLEDGDRMIEFAEKDDYCNSLHMLRIKVKAKVNVVRRDTLPDGSC